MDKGINRLNKNGARTLVDEHENRKIRVDALAASDFPPKRKKQTSVKAHSTLHTSYLGFEVIGYYTIWT